MGLTLRIQTRTGELVAPTVVGDELLWVLEEATEYRLDTGSDALVDAWLDALLLPRIDVRTARLYLGHWTSSSRRLRVNVASGTIDHRIRVVPRRDKLDESAWTQMLADLEHWLPGLSVGTSGGTSGGIHPQGVASAGFTAVALLPALPGLRRALDTIAEQPRARVVEHIEHVPLRSIRRADPSSLTWLSRHPSAAIAVDAWRSLVEPGPEPSLPRVSTSDDIDHPVNRYVVWAVRQAERTLRRLAQRLDEVSRRLDNDDDTRAWCVARSRAADLGARELRDALRRSALARVAPEPPSDMALLALQDDPAYSRFHRMVRPFVSPRYRSDAVDSEAPSRPSYELYELWTFAAVVRGLADQWPDAELSWHHKSNGDFTGGMGQGSRAELCGPSGRIEVSFNRTFKSHWQHDPRSDKPFSLSAERRPDIVIAVEPLGGDRRWIFLDAKYRVSRSALAEAFSSVHIYRDALRWPAMGARCAGGLLLVPDRSAEAEAWFHEDFVREHRCGCVRLRPGATQSHVDAMAWIRWLLESSR